MDAAMHNPFVRRVFSMKTLSFNALTTPYNKSDLSCFQSACIKGDIETVRAILNGSPDKLDNAIALNVKIGPGSSHFPGQSVYSVLSQQDSEKHKQILEIVEKVTEHFQSQSLLHLAAKRGSVKHLQRLLDGGECVDSVSPDKSDNGATPLMLAARFNETNAVEFLVARGASLEIQDHKQFTPFLHAVMGGKIRNIIILIEFGANILKVASHGNISALHLASANGHTEVIHLLLDHGVNVQKYVDDVTPLMLAAENGHLETIKLLLKNGASLHSCDNDWWTPLHFAASRNHLLVVKFLLQNGANLFAKTALGETVLHLATRLELVRFLVEQGADIHKTAGYELEEITPLHVAARQGQCDTVKYLLTLGADINSRDQQNVPGRTALFYAVQGSQAATAKVLIDSGCEFKLEDDEGCFLDDTVLEVAAQNGLTDVVQLLLARGVPVDAISRNGKTPLMAAAEAGYCDLVALLLDRGANINGCHSLKVKKRKHISAYNRDSDSEDSDCAKEKFALNQTPLYCALEAGQGEVAKLLIERGANTSDSDGKTHSLAELAALHGLSDVFHLLTKDKSFHFNKIKDGETLLTSAARRGDFHSVKFLLQNGADVNAKNVTGNTAISSVFWLQSSASSHAVLEIVKLLLAFGATINTTNDKYETPLLLAVQKNFENVAELLCERGCETKINSIDSYSPLHCAARNNNGKMTEMLLRYGADANLKEDYCAMTPLHVASSTNRIHASKVLLEYGVDTEVTDKLGKTPLAVAVERVCLPLVESLLQHGSNVHVRDKSGNTPLITAVQSYCDREERETTAVVKMLFDHGSFANATDGFGRSAVHHIQDNASRDLFDLFLQHGADVNLSDKNGETPLHFAATHGNTVFIEWLIEQGADVGTLDRKNRTPLHSAAYKGGSVELLIQHGADVHLTDSNGWLPLHFAAAGGQRMAFEVLLQNGSDIAAVDNKGRTVFHLVATYGRYGWEELVELLISQGCDINARDFSGQTVFGTSLQAKVGFSDDDFVTDFFRIYIENGGDKHAVDMVTGRTTLHVAAAGSHADIVDNLLDEGLDLEVRDKNGDTPLHRAAAHGTPEMIRRLVGKGTDLSAVNNKGQTPLLVCLATRNSLSVEQSNILLESGSNVHAVDKCGNTALHYAVRDSRLLKILVRKGGDVNAVNVRGCTPLHQAAYHFYSAHAVKVLLKAGGNVHCRDKQGNMPLHLAVAAGCYETVEMLINRGSDVHATNLKGRTYTHMMDRVPGGIAEEAFLGGGQINAVDELGCTPLHLALFSKCGMLVKWLLRHGSDPNAVDYKGSTPLHVGCSSGNKEAVSIAIDHGSSLEAKDAKGCTPLHICAVFDQKKTARILLERGADVEATDNEGSTPLHLASAFSDADMVSMFAKRGAKVSSSDCEGGIALHTAAALGKTKSLKILIDAGSDVNAHDAGGNTPLHVSAGSGHLEVVHLLLDNGADLHAVNKEGLSPVSCAELFGHKKVKRLLQERR